MEENHFEVGAMSFVPFLVSEGIETVLVMTKAYDVDRALIDLAKQGKNRQIIIGCNGIGFSQAARISTWTGVLRLSPYKIQVLGESRIECFGAEDFQEILRDAEFPVVSYESCAELEWQKAFCNIGTNALATLAACENGMILQNELLSQTGTKLVQEAVSVAQALGVDLGNGVMERYRAVLQSSAKNINSTLAGRLRGETRTEIPWLNGVVSSEGRRLGIPVPLNDLMSGLFT